MMLTIIIIMAAFMAARAPCRLKACRGVIHRGACPRRQAYGVKGGRPTGPLSAAEKSQRIKAARKTRRASISRNAAVKKSNLKRVASRIAAGLCSFCGLQHDGAACAVASKAGAGRIVAALERSGAKAKATAAAEKAARLKRAAAIISRPLINMDALPPSWPLACESCGTNAGRQVFAAAFNDNPGWGVCNDCAPAGGQFQKRGKSDAGSVSIVGILSLLLWPVALMLKAARIIDHRDRGECDPIDDPNGECRYRPLGARCPICCHPSLDEPDLPTVHGDGPHYCPKECNANRPLQIDGESWSDHYSAWLIVGSCVKCGFKAGIVSRSDDDAGSVSIVGILWPLIMAVAAVRRLCSCGRGSDNDASVHRASGYPDLMRCERCGDEVPTPTLRLNRVRLIHPPYGRVEAWCRGCDGCDGDGSGCD